MRLSPRRSLAGVLGTLALALFARDAGATPPDFVTFRRPQQVAHQPDPQDVLRVWMFYIGQGDSLLIQLPPRFDYDSDGDGEPDERMDILVDSGPANGSHPERQLRRHVNALYPNGSILEHVVITHHDLDHVGGFTPLLGDPDIGVEHIYHNGLASFDPDAARLSGVTLTAETAIFDARDDEVTRVMGEVDGGGQLRPGFLIDDLGELRQAFDAGELQGVYRNLARAVLEKDAPFEVAAFERASVARPFIMETEAATEGGVDPSLVQIQALWPSERPRRFGSNWGESINGNSVTFRLSYRDFSMLFTGDHNEHSEAALRGTAGVNSATLDCDVLKVPHHGSSHFEPAFIGLLAPVLSVASQGSQGFFTNWKHPATQLVQQLGRSHRFYSTFVHETRFDYDDLPTRADREPLVEERHILVETDGHFFRLVEVELDEFPQVPSVQQTRRGNGTRWVRASGGGQ